ncbi:unnamed protein product [Owenia fusiformis]|uniref:Uncharacterized protein n=1 Tax=Owenia fusiformis TaxID=6347 RepID=A0A8J1XJ26_OWEFU|nr:unnamed protein product [Owenia fusiformis]
MAIIICSRTTKLVSLISFILCLYLETVLTLECYKCQSLELPPGQTDDEDVKEQFARNTNPGCRDPFDSKSGDIVTCPNAIFGRVYKCGLVRGTSELYIPVTGRFRSDTWIRDCMQVSSGTENTCQGTEQVEDLVNQRYSKMSETAVNNVILKGEACFCQTNLCPPGGRCVWHQFYVHFSNTCVSGFIIGGVALGVILIITGVCLYCFCCKRKKEQYV